MRLISLLLLCLCGSWAFAQEALTAAKCFTEAPFGVISYIDENTRLDMLDYFRAGSSRASTNDLDGECIITEESSQSLRYIPGADCECQLFVLNADSPKPYIAQIETLCTPIPDSQMAVYNSRWQPQRNLVPKPKLADWLLPEGRKHIAQVEEEIPFIMASYSFDPDTQDLTVTNNMRQYFSADDTPQSLQWLRSSITYHWDGKQFKPAKP